MVLTGVAVLALVKVGGRHLVFGFFAACAALAGSVLFWAKLPTHPNFRLARLCITIGVTAEAALAVWNFLPLTETTQQSIRRAGVSALIALACDEPDDAGGKFANLVC